MFLSRFRVRGYKCLEDVEVPLTPIHVFIGPGGCGKTSLLEAISALYGRLKTPAAQWFAAVARPRDLITHGSPVPTIDLAGQWSKWQGSGSPPIAVVGYGYSIFVPSSGGNLAVTDQWVRPPSGSDPQSGLARVAIPYPSGAGSLKGEDRQAEATFRATVQKVLQPAPVYRLEPRRLAEPAVVDPTQDTPLAADGYGLSLLLEGISQRHPERFSEIEKEFCRIVPQYQNIGFQSEAAPAPKTTRRTGKTSEVSQARGLVFETCSGRRLAACDVSAGTLLLLTLATLARLPEPPSMMLIENPEQGLYPTGLGEVILPLRKAASRSDGRPFAQIIITTHSPAVLNCFDADEVTLLSRPIARPEGSVFARPLRCIEKIQQRLSAGKARLGDLWSEFGEPG